jgi:FMN phosphatase YigB (HAD superfamily)
MHSPTGAAPYSTSHSDKSRSTMRTVFSFDLFDTLVTRRTATPYGVFLEMAQRLKSHSEWSRFAHDFPGLRVTSEREARRRSPYEEITLAEIYLTMSESRGIDLSVTEKWQRLEMDLEREMIVPIPQAFARVRSHLECGQEVVVISDMYLPAPFLRDLLVNLDHQIGTRCRLFVSSEYRVTKGTGNLFKRVAEELSVAPHEIKHAGDNRRADVMAARRFGATAVWVRDSELTNWEMLAHDGDSREWQRRAGGARRRRLSGGSMRDAIGYSIAGPILGPFVDWALREAREQGCRKVFFLARDGWLLQEMAHISRQRPEFAGLEIGYLYGSRQAWRLPAMTPPRPSDYRWALTSNRRATWSGVAARLGLDPLPFFTRSRELGVPGSTLDTPLDASQHASLQSVLEAGHFDAPIQEAAIEQAERFAEYLRDQGLQGDERFALVDLGWKGTMQDALQRFLSQRGETTKLTGLYFGLSSTASSTDSNPKQSFAASIPRSPLAPDFFHDTALFLEALSTACHGSTVRYDRDMTGRVVPVLDNQSDAINAWGYAEVAEGALDFLRDHCDELSDICTSITALQLAADYLAYVRSSRMETHFAECLGSFPFTPDSDASTIGELGPRRSWFDGLRFVAAHSQKRMEISAWPQATARRSGVCAAALFHPNVRWLGLLAQPWRIYDFIPYSVSRRVKAVLPRPIVRRLERLLFGRSFETNESSQKPRPNSE